MRETKLQIYPDEKETFVMEALNLIGECHEGELVLSLANENKQMPNYRLAIMSLILKKEIISIGGILKIAK